MIKNTFLTPTSLIAETTPVLNCGILFISILSIDLLTKEEFLAT
jgi:hypothetical protein